MSPESFYKGSIQLKRSSLQKRARQLEAEGASLIDVGAMSTAPYLKTHIAAKEEAKRLTLALKAIRSVTKLPLSVDTSRAVPALAAYKAGARILNDVHGLQKDPHLLPLARRFQKVILMAHPNKEDESSLKHPLQDTKRILKASLKVAQTHGLTPQKIILDPGIGFF